jgi:hypothetical protein
MNLLTKLFLLFLILFGVRHEGTCSLSLENFHARLLSQKRDRFNPLTLNRIMGTVMDTSIFSSPPFQIGEPLKELTQEDFAEIFPNEGKLTILSVGGGLSGAKIYKVTSTASKKIYLVRYSSGIFGPKEIFHEFAIQKKMGSLGVSPKVYYSNPKRGIVVMDYIDNKLSPGRDPNILNNISGSYESLVKLIRDVHESQELNRQLTDRIALDYIKRSYQQLPDHFLDRNDTALLERIVNTPWPADKPVLSHNDFRSDNLLYDGKRFYLIDWELGGLSHPFYDLAYFANYQALLPKEGEELLSLYLKKMPTCEELKTFSHLRRIAFGFSATLALPGLAELGDVVKQPREGEPSFNSLKELWKRIDEGSLNFEVPRNEYRISLFLLRASADY